MVVLMVIFMVVIIVVVVITIVVIIVSTVIIIGTGITVAIVIVIVGIAVIIGAVIVGAVIASIIVSITIVAVIVAGIIVGGIIVPIIAVGIIIAAVASVIISVTIVIAVRIIVAAVASVIVSVTIVIAGIIAVGIIIAIIAIIAVIIVVAVTVIIAVRIAIVVSVIIAASRRIHRGDSLFFLGLFLRGKFNRNLSRSRIDNQVACPIHISFRFGSQAVRTITHLDGLADIYLLSVQKDLGILSLQFKLYLAEFRSIAFKLVQTHFGLLVRLHCNLAAAAVTFIRHRQEVGSHWQLNAHLRRNLLGNHIANRNITTQEKLYIFQYHRAMPSRHLQRINLLTNAFDTYRVILAEFKQRNLAFPLICQKILIKEINAVPHRQ